jgi:predicted methyltransferase
MRCLIAVSLLAAVAGIATAATVPVYVAGALADPARPKADRDADALRRPGDTIAFAGVKPGMIVGEFYPGGGYFTRLLRHVVGPKGHVYAIENEKWVERPEQVNALVAGRPANASIEVGPFGMVHFPRPLDVAWITQNYHDLKIAKYGTVDIAAFNRAVFAALKPGGTFFVLDHEASPGTTNAAIEQLHRIEKAQVIREVTAAGFRLAGEGAFLRHPGDDHTRSIFDKTIQGRTDQYALRFVKPA